MRRRSLHPLCGEVPRREAKARVGLSVVELLVALLLGILLLSVVVGAMLGLERGVKGMADDADVLSTLRTASHLLRAETGNAREEAGAWIWGPDSVALRIYRGWAWICPGSVVGSRLLVEVHGIRRPDPRKDSVLLVGGRAPRAVRLESRRRVGGACGAGPTSGPNAGEGDTPGGGPGEGADPGWMESWTLSEPPPKDGVVARFFERGAYHLFRGALRYRRGRSGRQPVTPEVLAVPPSGFFLLPDGSHEAVLVREGGADSQVWRVPLGGPER
ncbi:MAG: hypothetical protein ACE5GJ_01845 [Gemmatimonadota bacterium]